MSRPSARRRPTALRLHETDHRYVFVATFVTFLAAACAIYSYKASTQQEGQNVLLQSGTLLCAGLILCCSALQRQFQPVKDCSATSRTPKLGDTAAIITNVISICSKLLFIQQSSAERAIALLLPLECLLRAHRGGFLARSSYNKICVSIALGIALLSDLFSERAIWKLLSGYIFLATAYFSTSLTQSQSYEQGDVSFWSGLLLLCSGGALHVFSHETRLPFTYLDIFVVLGGVTSRAWYATQPRAIWTSIVVVWPVIVGMSVFLGFNIIHSVSWFQLVSYGIVYYVLTISVQAAGASDSARSATNGVAKSKLHQSSMKYYISEITKDKESREIFYFLLLNLTFMVVQMLYGIWTNSLGLISDSIHMFFDCLALAVGLVAAVMSKWPASQNHPFGFAKVEIISGFANGIFLVLISISIMIEALERLMEPPEMKTDQLLLISTLGLCVNLVGIFAFNHGHHHGHSHGHGHDHSHGHAQKEQPDPLPTIHTPKVSRSDGTFDHARGLQSPMPDFSNFAGFESPQLSSNGFNHNDRQSDDGKGHISWPSLQVESHGHHHRSRSPIRRPGSPLKSSHEPVLADLAEMNERTPERSKVNGTHAHDHDFNDKIAKHDKHCEHGHGHDHQLEVPHGHARTLSYDLTADHSHVGNSCSSHGHDHAHHHGHEHNHGHGHEHKHGHDHSHNMEGIFLHILADTLGSAGVIVSTILIRLFGWTGFDPLASIFIAVLIFLSVVPLLKSSFADLLLTLADDQEYILREVLGEVSLISGVGGIPFIRFWVDGEQKMHGILTIRAGIDGDTDLVRQKVRRKLQDGVPNLADVIVQVDRLEQ